MLFVGNSIGLRYLQIYKNMSMKCFAQNTKQIILAMPHIPLFQKSLKQYGAQRLSLLPVIPQGEFLSISCFFTHMLSSTG